MKQPLEIPAAFATQVSLMISDDGWRLSFGEPVDSTNNTYHTAVFLPTRTAHKLIQLMNAKAQEHNGTAPD